MLDVAWWWSARERRWRPGTRSGRSARELAGELRERGIPAVAGARSIGPPEGFPRGVLCVAKLGYSVHPWRILDADSLEVASFPRKRDALHVRDQLERLADWSVGEENWTPEELRAVRAIIRATPGAQVQRAGIEASRRPR